MAENTVFASGHAIRVTGDNAAEVARHVYDALAPGSVVLALAKDGTPCASCAEVAGVSPHDASHVVRRLRDGKRWEYATCWRGVTAAIERAVAWPADDKQAARWMDRDRFDADGEAR